MAATPAIRLYVNDTLGEGQVLALDRDQSHYLINVMRVPVGTKILLFNGHDGEWQGDITRADKKAAEISLVAQTRPQHAEPDVWVCFAPIKKDRTDFIIEKATELGVSRLQPMFTERTQTSRVNVNRLQATAREAAEQSERLSVPDVKEPVSLPDLLKQWPADRRLIHLDETGTGAPLAKVLMDGADGIGFLIGPVGGFAPGEVEMISKHPNSVAADLGPRILRAETACTAALGVRQSIDDLTRHAP